MECLTALLVLAGLVALVAYLTQGSSDDRPRSYDGTRSRPRPAQRGTSTPEPEVTVHLTYGGRGHDWSPPEIRRDLSPDAVWVAPGREVSVQGYTLPGGMTYVGSGLAAGSSGWSLEPALIDPELPVDRRRPDRGGELLDRYAPTYAELAPASRAAYLEWLAAGRATPDTPIGYVFLFFYGLERRFLEDRKGSAAARREAPELVAEVERLLELYADNHSFRGYASRFLDFARLDLGQVGTGPPPELTDATIAHGHLSDGLRLALGRLVRDGEPIPVDHALAWLRSGVHLRTPAHRCEPLFRPLFERHYRGAYGDGLRLKPNKTKLEISYYAASAGLHGVYSHATDLPDVARLTSPLRKLREIAERATDDLDAYSRWLGRNADDDNHLPGLALVPREVFHLLDDPRLERLRDWLQTARDEGGGPAAVPAGELIAHWPAARPDRLAKKEAAGLAQLLDRLGYGLEPDVRFGGPTLKAEQQAVVFRLGEDTPEAPSREYAAASVLLHLAAVVAAADGTVTEEEERHLEGHLEEALHLGDGERRRLRVHLQWLLTEQPSLAGMKRRLKKLGETRRRALGSFVVTVAGADGRIDPQEVKVLTRIYDLLGLDEGAVFSDVHALEAGAAPGDGPRTVVLGRPRPTGYQVPPQPAEVPAKGFRLDMDKVRAKRRESAETARILTEIFQQDEEVPVPAPAMAATAATSLVAGLDAPHSALLRSLAGAATLPRGEFDARAEALGLLPAGALDLLNDAAFEICDEPVLEGDDPLEVNRFALEEMTP